MSHRDSLKTLGSGLQFFACITKSRWYEKLVCNQVMKCKAFFRAVHSIRQKSHFGLTRSTGENLLRKCFLSKYIFLLAFAKHALSPFRLHLKRKIENAKMMLNERKLEKKNVEKLAAASLRQQRALRLVTTERASCDDFWSRISSRT